MKTELIHAALNASSAAKSRMTHAPPPSEFLYKTSTHSNMIKRAILSTADNLSKSRSPCVASLRPSSMQQKRYSSQAKEIKEAKDEIDVTITH